MKERIKEIIMKKNWTLSDILDMDSSVNNVVQEVIVNLTIEEKYYLVEDVDFLRDEYPDEVPMGKIISRQLATKEDWIFSKQSHHFSKRKDSSMNNSQSKTDTPLTDQPTTTSSQKLNQPKEKI